MWLPLLSGLTHDGDRVKVWVWLILLHLEGTEKPITLSSIPGLRITLEFPWTDRLVRGIFFRRDSRTPTNKGATKQNLICFFQGLVWEVSLYLKDFCIHSSQTFAIQGKHTAPIIFAADGQ